MRLLLTDLAIQRLKHPGRFLTVWDVALPSFGLIVGKHAKTFIVVRGQDRQRIKLGRYGQVSLQEARMRAAALIDGTGSIRTPQPQISSLKATQTYLRTIKLSPRWLKEQERLLTKHFLSKFATKPLTDITPAHILSVTDRLAATPSEQIHAHKALHTFFSWADRRSLIATNPTAKLQLPARLTTRDRVLTHDELKKVWNAAEQLGTFGIIARLLILTGQRRGEISNLHKATIANGTITWPKELIKNRREHHLPVTARTLMLAQSVCNAAPRSTWSKPKDKLDQLSGVTNWTLHDLRRTFATNLAELGVAPHVIEAILNHKSGTIRGVAATYNRYKYLAEMRDAMTLYEIHLLQHVVVCKS